MVSNVERILGNVMALAVSVAITASVGLAKINTIS